MNKLFYFILFAPVAIAAVVVLRALIRPKSPSQDANPRPDDGFDPALGLIDRHHAHSWGTRSMFDRD